MNANLEELDLRHGFDIVTQDLKHRTFVRPAFQLELFLQNKNGCLEELRKAISAKNYYPSAVPLCEVPKSGGTIRSGQILTVQDHIVYSAVTAMLIPSIVKAVSWPDRLIDYSYQIDVEHAANAWFKSYYKAWKAFADASMEKLKAGVPLVLMTDISSYYDHIDIGLLISDLRTAGAPETALTLLSMCLNRWAVVQGKGIPQGYSASDALAKLYLNSVDRRMRDSGYDHLRYVDDLRVFCSSAAEAKRALVRLCVLLRERGLSAQSSKTSICISDDAKRIIESDIPQIEQVEKRYLERIREATNLESGYLSLSEAEYILSSADSELPLKVIRDAFKAYFIDAEDSKFNKSLFHYLIHRLGKQGDDFALDYCMAQLGRRPEETSEVLNYIEAIGKVGTMDDALAHILMSYDFVYSYQKYQIVEWRNTKSLPPSHNLVVSARTLADDKNEPEFVRMHARKLLSVYGEPSDLENVMSDYPNAGSHVEKSDLICCLGRLEKGRRNAFLARVEHDGELCRQAVVSVKKV